MKKILFLSLVCCVIFSCKKKKTIWNSDWTAPIVNDTLTLNKYVKTGSLVANSGYYELDFTRKLLDLNLAEVVRIPDTTISKSFGIAFPNFLLQPGTSFVNSIEENSLNAPGIQLKKIRLSKGSIVIRLENPVNTPVFFKMELVGVSKNGKTFQEIFKAPAGSMLIPGICVGEVDISGYELDLTGVSGGEFNVIQSKFTVTTDPNGVPTKMTNKDITKVSATFKNLNVDYARGYFGDKTISDTIETSIDFLSNIKGGLVDFPTTDLRFSIVNGLKIPAKAALSFIKNINSNGGEISLNTNSTNSFQFGELFNLDPAKGSWSTLSESTKEVIFNSQNSNIENYLENLGTIQKIGYSIHLNPWGNISGSWNELFPSSKLEVSIKAKIPLKIGLDGLTLKNTFDFKVKQNIEKTHITSGSLILLAINAFPISGKIELDLLDNFGNILFTIEGTEKIKSSLEGATYSKTLQTCSSTIHFLLTNDIINQLDKIKKVTIISKFDTKNNVTNQNEKVNIPEGAFLGVKLKGDFKIENKY